MSLPLANDSLSSRAVDGSYPPRLNLNPNNFRYFKQAYIAYCKRTFPEGGNTLQTNTYPQFIDPLNPGGGPQSMEQKLYFEELKEIRFRQRKFQNETSPAVTGSLMQCLSDESLLLIRSDATFANIYATNDFLALWQLIETKHVAGTGRPEQQIHREIRVLESMMQGNKSLRQHSMDYSQQMEKIIYLGNNPDGAMAASRFLFSLDAKFSRKVNEILSSANPPQNFADAKNLIIAFDDNQSSIDSLMNRSRNGGKNEVVSYTQQVRPSSSEKRPNSQFLQKRVDDETKEFKQPTTNNSSNNNCRWCKLSGHSAQTCRKLERYLKRHPNAAASSDDDSYPQSSLTNRGDRRSSRSRSRSKSPSSSIGSNGHGSKRSDRSKSPKKTSFPSYMYPMVHFSNDDDDDDEEDDMSIAEEHAHVAVVNDEATTLISDNILYTYKSIHTDNLSTITLMIDTGSTVNVVNDISLLCDVTSDSGKEIVIHGIGSTPTRTHTKGIFSIFGVAYFVPGLPFCIISYSQLRKMMKAIDGNLQYSSDSDSFNASFVSHSLSFVRDKNLYLCHISKTYLSSLLLLTNTHHHANAVVAESAFATKAKTIKIADSGEFISQERRANAVAVRKLHEMLGHPSDSVLGPALDNGVYRNLSLTSQALTDAQKILGRCTGCDLGKLVRPTEKSSVSPPIVKIASLLHMDIYFCTGEADRKEPYLICVTESGGMVYSIHLESKSAQKLLDGIMSIVYDLHSHGHKVDVIRTDREIVFVSLSHVLSAVGIHMEFTSPDQHEKQAERAIRVIKERIRCILHSLVYTLPRSLYKYLNEFAVNCINLVPNSQSGIRTPYEIITKKVIDAPLSLKARFGEFVLCRVPSPSTDKAFDRRGEFGIVVGRDLSSKGSIKVFLLHSSEIVTRYAFTVVPPTQDLIRLVNDIAAKSSSINAATDPLFASTLVDPISLCDLHSYAPSRVGSLVIPTRPIVLADDNSSNSSPIRLSSPVVDESAPHTLDTTIVHNNNSILYDNTNLLSSNLPSSSLPSPIPQSDYRGDIIIANDPPLVSNIPQPPAVVDANHLTSNISSSSVSAGSTTVVAEPNDNVVDTNSNPTLSSSLPYLRPRDNLSNWKTRKSYYLCYNLTIKKAEKLFPKADCDKANQSELRQLIDMGAFEPLSARDYRRLFDNKKNPKRFRILPCHMFIKAKYDASGKFEKLKSRLVAGGNMQEELDEFQRTSPTAQISSLLVCVSIAAKCSYHTITADVKAAYLNASLPSNQQHLMRFPSSLTPLLINLDPTIKDCVLPDGSTVVRLVKALYGLQESALLWYETISSTLINDLKFSRSEADKCIFVYSSHQDQNHCIIVLYVDDLFICCQQQSDLKKIVSTLTRKYKDMNICTDTSSISYLGMEFKFNNDLHSVSVTQSGYVGKILESYPNIGTATSPATNDLLNENDSDHIGNESLSSHDQKQFVSLLMKLMYLAKRTRPDILMPISYLATKSHGATVNDFNKLFRVLKYINGTKELGLNLSPTSLELNCFIDASFAIHADARSHSGIVISLGPTVSPVAVFSKKQVLTTKSSTEAELVALDEGVTTLIWFQRLMNDLSYASLPSIVYQDNQSTIHIARHGPNGSRRTRHINVRYFFVKDHLETGNSIIKYLPTEDMVADLLTKPFTGTKFRELRDQLLNSIPHK